MLAVYQWMCLSLHPRSALWKRRPARNLQTLPCAASTPTSSNRWRGSRSTSPSWRWRSRHCASPESALRAMSPSFQLVVVSWQELIRNKARNGQNCCLLEEAYAMVSALPQRSDNSHHVSMIENYPATLEVLGEPIRQVGGVTSPFWVGTFILKVTDVCFCSFVLSFL